MATTEELNRVLYHYTLGNRGVRKTYNNFTFVGDKIVFTVTIPLERAAEEIPSLNSLLERDVKNEGAGLITDLFTTVVDGKAAIVEESLGNCRVVAILKGASYAVNSGFVYLDERYKGASEAEAIKTALYSTVFGAVAADFTGWMLGLLVPSPTKKFRVAKVGIKVAAGYAGAKAGQHFAQPKPSYTFAVAIDIDEFVEQANLSSTRHAESFFIYRALRHLDGNAEYLYDCEMIPRIAGEHGNENEEPVIAIVPDSTGSDDLGSYYVIQTGDTLSELAERFGITVEDLAAANGITDPDKIFVGSELVIPTAQGSVAANFVHRDNLESFAETQDLSLYDAWKQINLSELGETSFNPYGYNWVDADMAAALNKNAYLSRSARTVLKTISNDTIADLIAWDGLNADMKAYAADAPYWNLTGMFPSSADTGAAMTNSIRVNLSENPGTSISTLASYLDDYGPAANEFTPADELAETTRRYSGQHQSAATWLEDVYTGAGEIVEDLLDVFISNGSLVPETGYGVLQAGDVEIGYNHVSYEIPVIMFTWPIALDMDDDGDIELVPLSESTAFFDMDGDGYLENTGWVGPDDGLLVYDMDNDGDITDARELSFKLWSDEAVTDMDGLRLMFDTDSDGDLDSMDDNFALFKIWQDLDQDGEVDATELTALSSKITSIDLDVEAMDDVAICVKTPEVFSSGVFQ